MKYIIIENEYFALESLKNIVAKARPGYEPVFTSESVEDSVAYFKTNPQADLIFMDIELVDGNCFEIFRKVQVDIPIIFTTAYDEFAIQAFKVNSVDYILKPVNEDSIEEALNKFEKLNAASKPRFDYSILDKLARKTSHNTRILISKGDGYSYIETGDIAYFYTEDKYTFIYTFSGKRYMSSFPNLNQVESNTDPEAFFRISRSIVANIKAVAAVKKYFNGRLKVRIEVGDESFEEIVSAAKREQFLAWLGSA